MAGEIGIGIEVIYEPVLADSSGLLPGSWDIITETGALMKDELGQQLIIEFS